MPANEENIESGIYNKGEIDLGHIIKSLKLHPDITKAGSIHTFTGIVRDSSINGKPVISMKIDAYDELANTSINKICETLKQTDGIIDIKIIHLKGDFELSEDLVYVVVASAHRKEGFEVINKAVEMYKKEIAVWKREDFTNGSSEWIH
ncbi:MAG: molybdenum cofactor biosynthesis protein MoaE [Candidatus Thorarchaeota archaeon]